MLGSVFCTANCPTAKNPRAVNYIHSMVILAYIVKLLVYQGAVSLQKLLVIFHLT